MHASVVRRLYSVFFQFWQVHRIPLANAFVDGHVVVFADDIRLHSRFQLKHGWQYLRAHTVKLCRRRKYTSQRLCRRPFHGLRPPSWPILKIGLKVLQKLTFSACCFSGSKPACPLPSTPLHLPSVAPQVISSIPALCPSHRYQRAKQRRKPAIPAAATSRQWRILPPERGQHSQMSQTPLSEPGRSGRVLSH